MPSIFQSIDSNLLHTVNGGEDATYKAGVNYAGLKLKNCLEGTKNIGNAHDRSWAEQGCFDNFVNVDMRDALKTVGVIPTSKALCVGVAQKPTTSKTSNGCFDATSTMRDSTSNPARPL